MIVPVVKAPNSVLLNTAKPVKKIDTKIKKLIKNMHDTLLAAHDPEGVGLAAPQIGVSLQLFIMKPAKRAKIQTFINPKIIKIEKESAKKSRTKSATLEGCLSIDNVWSPIRRAAKIQVVYQSEDGQKHEEWFSDFKAVIIQHEIDHLNGVLFTHRAMEQKSDLFEEEDGELFKLKIS